MRLRSLCAALAGAFTLLTATAASAQTAPVPSAPAPAQPAPPARPRPDNRIPLFAIDARGMFAALGDDELTRTSLFIPVEQMKSKAFGLQLGAHAYPWRGQAMALGIGAEAVMAGNSFETVNVTTLKPTGTIYDRRLRGVSGQVSLNFGHQAGWSYITAGLGSMTLESYLDTLLPDGLSQSAFNYGAGARWYTYDHLAFTLDLRFYATPPAPATPNTAARLRHTIFVMSAGVSIK